MRTDLSAWRKGPAGIHIPTRPDLISEAVLGHRLSGEPIRAIRGGAQRGIYTVEFTNKAATAAMADFDYFEIDAAADKPVEIVAIFIGQETQEGDANEDWSRWAILRFSGGTFTSGGEVSTTPRPLDPSDGAASGAYEAFNANGGAASSSGTTVRLHSDTFNLRTGLQVIFPPEMRHKVDGAAQSAMVVRHESTLDATTNFSGTLYVREL